MTDREAIKARFIAERGYWRPWTEALLDANPRFLDRYARYAGHPARTGPLSEKMVELIYVALDASSTHLFGSGLRTHMEKALAVGASVGEIFDVLHLVTAQGLDRVYQAAGILAEEVAGRDGRAGCTGDRPPRTDDAAIPALAARAAALGVPLPAAGFDLLARLDPAYLTLLMDFLEHGCPANGLATADRRLIEVALCACFTGFDATTLRHRIRGALDAGHREAAVLEAIQLGAHLAVHGAALGAGVHAELRAAEAARTPNAASDTAAAADRA